MAKKTTTRKGEAKAAAKAVAPETVAKGVWARWSGRQHKTLNEQAARYGAPIGGRVVSLPEVARWLHDFLADNARRLASAEADAEELSLEYWKTQRERLRYQNESAQRLDRGEIHHGLGRMAAVLRQTGEALQREYPGAEVVLNQALEDFEREVDRLFGGDDSSSPDQS